MNAPAVEVWWARLRDRYGELSLRERILVALTLVALTWLGWAFTLGDGLGATRARLAGAVVALENRIGDARAEQERLESGAASDPDAGLRRERQRLGQQIDELDARLGSTLDRFVDPERMPALLEDVIRHHDRLALTRMESLPAEPMELVPDGGDAATVRVYRHPLRLTLEGSYFDVMAYLAELETGPWELGWRRLDYAVSRYPTARVTLEIETLSRERSWIGV